jgi:hypothetical protein
MGIDYKGDAGPDGTVLGRSASDLVGFHGKAPSDQRAFTADVSTSAPTQTSPFGFATSAQPIALLALVNEIKAILVEKGLMAAS